VRSHHIERVGEDRDFVASLFENALMDAELFEPLDFLHKTADTRSDGLMDLQTKREGSKQAQQTDDVHPPVRLAAPPLSRRVLNVDEGHLHPQQPTECGSQVPRVIFNARGNLAIEPRRREFRLDALEAA